MKSLEELFEEVYVPENIRELIEYELEFIDGFILDEDEFYEALDVLREDIENTSDEEIKNSIKQTVLRYWPDEFNNYDETRKNSWICILMQL